MGTEFAGIWALWTAVKLPTGKAPELLVKLLVEATDRRSR